MFKTAKKAEKTFWFFQKELTNDFESKFESCIFCNICLCRVTLATRFFLACDGELRLKPETAHEKPLAARVG